MILSQTIGLTVLVLIGISAYFMASALSWNYQQRWTVPLADQRRGATIPVELTGEPKKSGVYYVPSPATLASFMAAVRLSLPEDCPPHLARASLAPGASVIVEPNRPVRLGSMAAERRLALDLPLDINRVGFADLLLIPGVKDATARRILTFRQAAGGRIERMEDLLQVKGIKEQKLRQLRTYLYVAKTD